jgi:hypothetical protein
MRYAKLLLLSFASVAVSAPQYSRAQDARSDVVMLPCEGKCATINRSLKRISGDPPTFVAQCVPHIHCPEGYVQLLFTIRADGHVDDDIAAVQTMAPLQYVAAAKRALRTWMYEPPMVDGQAVPALGGMTFRFEVEGETGARPAVDRGYAEAADLLKAGKLDEAHAKLTEMLKDPSLNFYERGVIMYPLVLIAMQRQQYIEAQNYSILARRCGAKNFSEAVYRRMFQIGITAGLAIGDVVGSAQTLGEYKKWEHFDPTDPVISKVAETQTKLDALPSYGVNLRIPDAAQADGWGLFLYRRYFTFTHIVGKLERLSIDCREKTVASPISDNAEWSVPKDWSDCRVFVRGTLGTTFQIVQFSSPQPDSH